VKISDILVNFLKKNKTLSLPKLGTFSFSETAYVLPDGDKQPAFPPGSVVFKADKSTPEDPELLDEIFKITGKFKPLASADLESFVLQGTQLINISKPFSIEGLGSIQKNHRNEIEFVLHVDQDNKSANEKSFEEPGEPIRFGENYLKPETKSAAGSRFLTIAALIIVALGLLGWVGYYVYQRSAIDDGQQLNTQNEPIAIQDTNAFKKPVTENSIKDTTSSVPNTVATSSVDAAQITPEKESASTEVGFNIVLEYAKKERAMKRYADLREWGHRAKMTTSDSITFKIFLPIKAPLSDSARHRDSLSQFFARRVWVEKL